VARIIFTPTKILNLFCHALGFIFRSGLLILFERWRNVTEEVQMIMTFQNPLDWASEAFYDSEENENSELERDPEIIFKTYLKELVFRVFILVISKSKKKP